MCVNPIRLPNVTGKDEAIVPCGKCPECLAAKANDLTVRVVREAEYFTNFWFVTLTYDNEHIPLMTSDYIVDEAGEVHIENQKIVDDPDLRKEFFDNATYTIQFNSQGRPVKRYEPYQYGRDLEDMDNLLHEKYVYYTVDNEDFKKFMKSSRIFYERHQGHKLPKFKYLCVPEYGGCSYRPHYHVLFLGLDKDQVSYLVSRWKYGSVSDVQQVSYTVEDMSKVAHYVSQYANKGNFDVPYIKDGYCKKPHRCFSFHFGVGDEEDLARRESYWKAEDVFGKYDVNDLSKFSDDERCKLVECVFSRRYYDLNGFTYPIPQFLKKRMFYISRTELPINNVDTNKEYSYEEKRELLSKPRLRKVRGSDGIVRWKVVKPNPNSKVASQLQNLVTTALFEHLCGDLNKSVEQQYSREIQSLVEVTPEIVEQLNTSYADSQENQKKTSELSLLNKIHNSIL